MFQQNILEDLTNLFPNQAFTNQQDWSSLAGLSQGSIAQAFGDKYDLSDEDLQADMFQQFTPEMLRAGQWKTYAPGVQAQGQSLLSGLYRGLGGAQAQKAAGGFAGSGGFQQQQAGARDVYGKSMIDVLSGAKQQQSQGLGNIQDIISSWHEAAQSIKGY